VRRNPRSKKRHSERLKARKRAADRSRPFGRWKYLELAAIMAISGSALRWVAAVLMLSGLTLDLAVECLEAFRTHVDWRDRRAHPKVVRAGGRPRSIGKR
jgi:hypothetical protein